MNYVECRRKETIAGRWIKLTCVVRLPARRYRPRKIRWADSRSWSWKVIVLSRDTLYLWQYTCNAYHTLSTIRECGTELKKPDKSCWSMFIGRWLGKSSNTEWIARMIWTTSLSSDVSRNNDRISCNTTPPMTSPNRLFQLFVYAMIGRAASKCLLGLGRIYAHGHFPPGEANFRKWGGRLSPKSTITRGKTVFQPTEHLTNTSGVMNVFMRRWW